MGKITQTYIQGGHRVQLSRRRAIAGGDRGRGNQLQRVFAA